MQSNSQFRLDDQRTPAAGRARGILAGALAIVTGAAVVVVGVMFSLVLLAAVTVLGLLIFGYVWWKTRELRRRMRERPPGGRVIEGEVIPDAE
jgi:Flp pilus assembly protein TadB